MIPGDEWMVVPFLIHSENSEIRRNQRNPFFFFALPGRVRASINRFRTKPGDFKAKLSEMFIAYYKAEGLGIPESRAAISRRFMMTPALFSRKLMDLSVEQRWEYASIAATQLTEERSAAAAAAATAIYARGGGASSNASSRGVPAEEALASSGSSACHAASSSTSASHAASSSTSASHAASSSNSAGSAGNPSSAAGLVGNAPASGRKAQKAGEQALSTADYVAHTVAVSIANEEKRRSFAATQGRSRNKSAK
jgi:hypothetical protein